jgi:hypothetical protein
VTDEHPFPGGEELGYFGNIWVRQNYLAKAGDTVGGHIHYFDHVTLLANGSVEIKIEGNEPKSFSAPTFITIRKDQKHQIKALEDNTYYYCVFAVRDIDGNTVDIVNPENIPWFAGKAPDNFWQDKDLLEQMSRDTAIENYK